MTTLRVAVLGGTGFIGTAVVHAATRLGMEVMSLGKPVAAEAAERVARTIDALAGYEPHLILHAASPPRGADLSMGMDEERQLLSALARLQLRATVVGSAAVLAGTPPDVDGRYSEKDVPHPISSYGRFKLQQETYVRDLGANGWPVLIARLFNPIGPGMKPHLMLGRLVREIVLREENPNMPSRIEMGSLSSVRDFMHVDDAADALLAVSRLSDAPPVIHIASGEGLSVGEIAQTALSMSTRVGLELHETLPSPSESAAVDRVVGDARLLCRLTGWKRTRTVEAGIEQALAVERDRVRLVSPQTRKATASDRKSGHT